MKQVSELSTSASFNIPPCTLSRSHRKAMFCGKSKASEFERTVRCYQERTLGIENDNALRTPGWYFSFDWTIFKDFIRSLLSRPRPYLNFRLMISWSTISYSLQFQRESAFDENNLCDVLFHLKKRYRDEWFPRSLTSTFILYRYAHKGGKGDENNLVWPHRNNNIQLATISSKRDAFYNQLVIAPCHYPKKK